MDLHFRVEAARLPKEDPIATLACALAVTAAGALTLVLVSGAAPALASSPTESCFRAAVNAQRAASGLAPLTADPALVAIAEWWAGSLAGQGMLEHNPDLNAEVPQVWQTLGENVGRGPSCSEVASAFSGSPEHRANILDPNYSAIGVGVAVAADGEIYVTEDFAGERTGTAPSAPTARSTPPTPPAPKPSPVVAPMATQGALNPAPGNPAPGNPAPAREAAATSRVMIEAVSSVTASGDVVPVSAPAPSPVPATLSVPGHHPRSHGKAGLLRRLGHHLRPFFSHLA